MLTLYVYMLPICNKKQSIFIQINQISFIIGLMFQVYNPDKFQRDQGVTEKCEI